MTGEALEVRWYNTFVEDSFEDTRAGVCQCSYGGTAAACEVKGGVAKPEVDPRDPKPYTYPSQVIKVAGKDIKIDITSAAEQVDDPNEIIIGVQGDVAGCISDEDYAEDPPKRRSLRSLWCLARWVARSRQVARSQTSRLVRIQERSSQKTGRDPRGMAERGEGSRAGGRRVRKRRARVRRAGAGREKERRARVRRARESRARGK